MSKTKTLRDLILSKDLKFLMEAHNGISAKIVENTGFEGIWCSGLGMSASMGVRDANELSWTQVCSICEFMSNVTDIPILVDGDTGFGDFNNFQLLVKKLEKIGVAGVCIEDKKFPKTNSFIESNSNNLAPIDEFCGKIMSGKDIQKDENFVVVARTEAFIFGQGVDEALLRAEKYVEAGCDAVLVHSKKSDSSEIDEFMKLWNKKAPVIVVPTKYYSTPTRHFEDIGVSTVIWANHNIRASISAMQDISKQILKNRSINDIEHKIASVNDIFNLQNMKEYNENKAKYLGS